MNPIFIGLPRIELHDTELKYIFGFIAAIIVGVAIVMIGKSFENKKQKNKILNIKTKVFYIYVAIISIISGVAAILIYSSVQPDLSFVFQPEIRYYGLMYAVAFLVGLWLMKKEAKRKDIDNVMIEDYAFIVMLSGVIGARIYYVVFNLEYYASQPFIEWFAVWHGGLAIHGGIIGGIISTLVFAAIQKKDSWVFGDIIAPALILGQTFGRFGNFMNGDAHGVPTITPINVMINNNFSKWWAEYSSGIYQKLEPLVPWGVIFPVGTPAGNEFPYIATHPVMIYELILNFTTFLLLWFVFRKKKMPTGTIFLIYIAAYGLIRAVVTIFRADDLMFFNIIRAPHLISIVMIVTSALIYQYKLKKFKNIKNITKENIKK